MVSTSLAVEAEWRLLLAACTPERSTANAEIESLLPLPLRWDRVFELAENHGVQPLLHQSLEDFRGSLTPQTVEILAAKQRTNLHKAMMLSRELIRILDTLTANDIEAMPYKGLALADSIYGDIALRQTGDIDLLVRAQDVARACEALHTLNYTPHLRLSAKEEKFYLRSGYEYSFDAPAGRNLLELQWALQPRFYAVDYPMEELFHRAVPVSVAGRVTKTLSFEHLFIVLALHAAKHAWGKLIWICDLARIMKMEGLKWAQIGSLAQRFRIRRILTLNLLLANEILGVSIPSAAEESVLEDRKEPLVEVIKDLIYSGVAMDVESVAYFRLMVNLRESGLDRARFIGRLIFTPGPGEWSSIRLPKILFPLYRVVRFSRLATRWAR